MHQFVQSAIDAAKQGDNNKAMAFIKQVLNANPNDVDAWLVLAAIVDDPQRKRQCLKRVLTLDPVNMVAREELLDMDRAEMGGGMLPFTPDAPGQTQYEPAPVSTPFYSSDSYAFDEPESVKQAIPPVPAKTLPQTSSPAKAPVKKTKEKPLVFKYPIVWRVLMYIFVAVFGCVGVLMLIDKSTFFTGLAFLGFSALMLIVALVISPTVEVSDTGIRASGIFSSAETGWDEIVKMKSNAMKRRLELTKRNKQMVNVSTQVSGYPQIVEILRTKRPDLFGIAPNPQAQTSAFSSSYNNTPSTSYESPSAAPSAPSFKGTRTFKRNFFRQYASYLLIIPLCLLAVSVVASDPDSQHKIGAGITVAVCIFAIFTPLFQVTTVKVTGNKLTVETLFEEKSFTAKEIREIKMQTVRGRYGTATNYVSIFPIKGKNYPLQGFSEGEEIIYGILTNWWNANRNG
jgi:lipopolysaccharide export LptBFGC system permease protein LptF